MWYDYLNPSHAGFHADISTNLINCSETTVKSMSPFTIHNHSVELSLCVVGVRPIVPEIHKLRVMKSEAEIKLMRMSASIAAQSFQEVRNPFPQ